MMGFGYCFRCLHETFKLQVQLEEALWGDLG